MNCMSRFLRLSGITALCVVAMFASGCATATPMALTSKTPTPTVGPENGLVLLVIETTKDGAGRLLSRLPIVSGVSVASTSGQQATSYSVPLEVVACDNNIVTHLVSLSLPSGEYKVERMYGYGLTCGEVDNVGIFRTPLGKFSFPINTSLSSSSGKIVYAGHIKAHMRPRKSETETHAASVVPLIDQQVAGFYPTTFDITITDDLESDVGRFAAKFPALKKEDVGKSLSTRNTQ